LFRLGWSRVKAKQNVEQGVVEMQSAQKILSNDNEISLKLA